LVNAKRLLRRPTASFWTSALLAPISPLRLFTIEPLMSACNSLGNLKYRVNMSYEVMTSARLRRSQRNIHLAIMLLQPPPSKRRGRLSHWSPLPLRRGKKSKRKRCFLYHQFYVCMRAQVMGALFAIRLPLTPTDTHSGEKNRGACFTAHAQGPQDCNGARKFLCFHSMPGSDGKDRGRT
jgi:hypothetical protein